MGDMETSVNGVLNRMGKEFFKFYHQTGHASRQTPHQKSSSIPISEDALDEAPRLRVKILSWVITTILPGDKI
jgi:hypothetical protein